MKYFAHYCSADDDPKIVELFDTHGYDGTGLYWKLCAIVAGMKNASGDTPEYLLLPRTVTSRYRFGTAAVQRVIRTLQRLDLIEAREAPVGFYIKIPKLNKYTDENTKRNERERNTKRPDNVRVEKIRSDQIREEEKDLKGAASIAPSGGASPAAEDQEPGTEDPQARAEAQKAIKAMIEQLGKGKAVDKAVEISRSEEPDKPGQPKTVDPKLEAELVDTRADIIGRGFDPARANQIITLLAEYHSGRMEAHQLSARLDTVVTTFEKQTLFEVDGVIDRRTA